MKRALLALATVGVLAGAATIADAQNLTVIQQRQALFKQMGDGSVAVGRMLRNEQPFDLAAAQSFLATVATNAPQFAALFPADSRTGANTAALPAIWQNQTEVNGLFARLGATATAARAAVTNEATFRANAPGVLGVCGECHRTYRERR